MQDAPVAIVFSPTRLREATDAAGLTQQDVAIALRRSMRAVQNWYLGERSPNGAALVQLAALLEREPSWFYVEEVAA
jgi:transcriptional regulator with XRE-family HTH domain